MLTTARAIEAGADGSSALPANADVDRQAAHSSSGVVLSLLGEFRFTVMDQLVRIGRDGQRVLTFLALHGRATSRDHVGHALWPDVSESRLLPHLRSVLWRLPPMVKRVIEVSASELKLDNQVTVDLHRSRGVASRLIDRSTPFSESDLGLAMRVNLREDLLPTWASEEWLTAERERFRQLRLHSLEILSELLTAENCYGAAADMALCSVSADRFRESARRAVINVHLAEGNLFQAVAEFDRYCQLLRTELSCEPSWQLRDLVKSAVANAKISPAACQKWRDYAR